MNKAKYLGLALAATLAACSTNDFDSVPAVNGNGMITAYTPQSNGKISTRTVYEAEGSNLNVKWNASGEDMYTINAYADGWTAGQLKQVSATDEGNAANFNAYNIEGTKLVGYKAGKLFAFYPQNATIGNSFTSLAADGASVSVPLSLTGQTGKLADLHNYDYMTATSTVSADNNVGDLQMKHEIAVLHINSGIKTLVENGTISKVVVSATGMKAAGTMTITRNGSDITTSVAGIGSDASIAINNCSYTVSNNQLADDIYLAILPGTMTNLTMKLTIGGNDFDYIYQGTTTNFEAGKIYNWSPTVDPGVMYFTIKTTASTKDFTIPFATSGNCPAQIVVNWGDGSSTTVNEGQSLSTTTFKHSYNSYDTTYRITVNSAQKDVTKVQVPEFNFGKYPSNTSSNSNKNENGELLYSVDSPVLYSGVTSLASMFYGADNLTSVSGSTFILYPDVTSMNNVFGAYSNGKLANIPTDLFTNNTKVTNFSWAFGYQTKLTTIPAGLFDKNVNAASFGSIFNNCTALTTVPAGLFDKNINVTDMNRVFRACTSLQSVPKGIFAKNIKVTNFVAVFAHDKKLKLNSEIFIDDTYTKTNRFTYVSSMIDFMWAFQNVGLDYLDNGQDGGEMPDLWNYTYTSNGVGVTTRGNAVYNYDLDGDNIFNDYPSHFSNWRSSGAYDIRSSGWFIGSNNKYSPTVLKKN